MRNLDSAVCCVCSRKYLPQAITMVWSLRRLSERFSYHIFISDITKNNGKYLIDQYPEIEFYFIDQFANQKILDNALMLTDLEFNTSLKPVALSIILQRYKRKTFYCDSDLYFLAEPLGALIAIENGGVVLTPHQVKPVSDESDFQMSRTGVFNAGFIGMSGDVGYEVVSWLIKKTMQYCLLEPEEGIFVDQKWLDLVPAVFDSVCILREPEYNLAYWNIEARGLNESTVFLHLSGFDLNNELEQGKPLSKYSSVCLDQRMIRLLRPYLDVYKKTQEQINASTNQFSISPIESNFKSGLSTMARRYSVKSKLFSVRDGEIQVSARGEQQSYAHNRLYRTEPYFLGFTRVLGEALYRVRLAGIIDKFVAVFRILGRRNSWIR